MDSYPHVLIALDFSETSDRVIRRGLALARAAGAATTLVHVVDYLPPLGFADDFTPSPALMIDEATLMKGASDALERFAGRHGLDERVARIVRLGTPRVEIVTVARELEVGVIVIGSHGRHGLRRLLGSTASAVLNDAPCDVLAVRADG